MSSAYGHENERLDEHSTVVSPGLVSQAGTYISPRFYLSVQDLGRISLDVEYSGIIEASK